LLLIAFLLGSCGTVQAQPPPADQPQDLTGIVRPEAVAARKVAVQAQLEALAQSSLPKEELEAARADLERLLQVLTALEEAVQKRAAFVAQLEALPQRLQELTAARTALEGRPPGRFARVTESLRDEYEAQVQAIQAELRELHAQAAAGEVRLAGLTKDIEQQARDRQLLEKDPLTMRSKTTRTGGQKPGTETELLNWKLQLLRAEEEALKAEREWLNKRGPLMDAWLSVAQTRLKRAQQDLETITRALSTTIQHEQSRLSSTATTIEQKLEQAADPGEALKLMVNLETVEMQKVTAEYRQQLNLLGDTILTQERHNARVQQEIDRFTSLVEKYSSGEGMAQRLVVIFERLRRERLRYSDVPVKALEKRLYALTAEMFTLDDRLYDFPRYIETRLGALSGALQAMAAPQRQAELAKVRQALEEQRAALREQQQVLAALVQEHTRLLTLHREYKRLLDDSYVSLLTQIFWLRDARTLSWDVVQDMVAGATSTITRLRTFVRAAQAHAWSKMSGAPSLWFIGLLTCIGLPWLVAKLRRRLRSLQAFSLATAARQETPPGLHVAILIVLQTALWPAYLALMAWLLGQFLPRQPGQADVARTLVSGLQLVALVLGAYLLGRTVLQQEGWGQRFWALSPALCRFLRRSVALVCLAALLLLVPYHILLTAPGEGEAAVGSLALARACFLAFQGLMLLLVGLVARRGSPLMAAVLMHSRQRDGLLWRIWPFVYLLLLAGGVGIIGLDVLGYRYAARFIWVRTLESLAVLLTLRLLLAVLLLRLLHRLNNYVFSAGGRLRQRYPDVEAAAQRYFRTVRLICNGLLGLAALVLVLEIWGVSISWLLTSPLGSQILTRVLLMALTVGGTAVVIQISKALTEYLILPRTTAQGIIREPSRKLKTLVPLMQTLIRAGAVFAAVLVILEQLNVATGPILAGVGIFGLAVGFASQSLIKDVINGLFILFEDSLSVGDVVTLRGIGGQVEKVTLRAVTIRDLSGNVHVIPNSTIDMITNMTKEYSRYVLDVAVSYREDADAVVAILREIDEAIRRDPAYGRDMLEPLEIMGLDRFEESAIVIRARLKTRPLQQWRIGREFNRRIKKVFDERGIEIPFPHRTLYWGTPKDGAPPPLRVTVEQEQPVRQEDAC
jgi:small-conductance mechanosensitive channel